MTRILLCDDNESELNYKSSILRSGNISVDEISKQTLKDMHDAARSALDAPQSAPYDAVIFDVAIGAADFYGGLQLHNKLVAGGYRNKWRHTILWTKHVFSDAANAVYVRDFSRGLDSSEMEKHLGRLTSFVIRMFAETAQIPYANLLRTGGYGSRNAELDRIREVVSLPAATTCAWCNHTDA